MKKLIFIHGPNGVGKSTLCKKLNQVLSNSAWLESEWCRCINPFNFKQEIELITEKNMSFILRSYLEARAEFKKYGIIIWNNSFCQCSKKYYKYRD